jgi:hypothetical protein
MTDCEPTQLLPLAEDTDLAADELLDGSDRTVMLGPVVTLNGDWYFIFATGKCGGIWTVKIEGADRAFAEETRSALWFNLIQHKPLIVHDFDDELEMARWAEVAWPSKQTRKIVSDIEAERAARRH